MNLPFFMARRYLFSKKSHNAINIISMVSVCGVVIATLALVIALSVYNGFGDLIATLFSTFDPEMKITPVKGKVFDPSTARFDALRKLPEVSFVGEVLEDHALIRYGKHQVIVTLKGVDQQYNKLTNIEKTLIDGRFALHEDVLDYATLGAGVASMLGVNVGFQSPIDIYVPKRDKKINLANPNASFTLKHVLIGGVFCMNQAAYDEHYMLVPLALTRNLFRYTKEVSALELKLNPQANIQSTKEKIKALLGPNYNVKDRYEQQAASFRMMRIEKWMTFLILIFILAIALFNVVGSLSMLMIEKKKDVLMLRGMGADTSLIQKIFLYEGWLISTLGALTGILIGLTLCFLQQKFGFISLGSTAGAFIIDAYPVRVALLDIISVFFSVTFIGFLAAWYPVYHFGHKWFKQ